MSAELRARAKAFLHRAVPEDVPYAPDSIAERLIATYAERGRLPDDPETAELLELAGMESAAMADRMGSTAGAEYFREGAEILQAIQAE